MRTGTLPRFQDVYKRQGVSVISYLAAQEEVVSGKVLSFDLDRKKAFRTIYIAWRKDTALTLSLIHIFRSAYLTS